MLTRHIHPSPVIARVGALEKRDLFKTIIVVAMALALIAIALLCVVTLIVTFR